VATNDKYTLPMQISEEKQLIKVDLKDSLNELETRVGGRHRLISALIISDNPKAREFAKLLAKQKSHQYTLWELCNKQKLNPQELFRQITEGTLAQSAVEAYVKVAAGMPKVVEKSVEVATSLGVEGFKDREMLLRLGGMLTDKSGPQVQVNLNQNFHKAGHFEQTMEFGSAGALDDPFIEAEEVEDVPS